MAQDSSTLDRSRTLADRNRTLMRSWSTVPFWVWWREPRTARIHHMRASISFLSAPRDWVKDVRVDRLV